jgi:hypothetical protein
MQIRRNGEAVTVDLLPREVELLRRALERASFIDTPMNEQAEIAAFCARALEALPQPSKA